MTVTASDVIARATGYSVSSDSSLTASSGEMLAKINAIQNAVFSRVASASKYFYALTDVTSTSGSAERSVDLSSTVGIERIIGIWATTNHFVPLSRVDWEDQNAELPPRYFLRGTKLVEVSNDWSDSTGTVMLTIAYAKQATQLDPTGSLTQAVTIPDAHADVLSLGLAAYLAAKDVGRPEGEADRLQGEFEQRLAVVIASLDHYGGTARRRFLSPETRPPETPGGSE
jgi:hypothetical protein